MLCETALYLTKVVNEVEYTHVEHFYLVYQ